MTLSTPTTTPLLADATMPYRIKTVAELLGIPRATLLAWERRYKIVEPARHENGYRAYSEADIEVLRAVKTHIDRGLKVSEAVSRVRSAAPPPVHGTPGALDAVRQAVMQALMSFDRDRALAALQPVSMVGFDLLLRELYTPLLREVGEAWCAGRASISQEHFTTGFVRERLTAMLAALNSGPRGGGRVLCSGFSDDPHELPVLIVATQLALAGFRVSSIGVSVPVEALAGAARESSAKLVCLTITLPRTVAELEAFLDVLRPVLPPDCAVALGGSGVPAGFPVSERVHVPASVDRLIALGRSL